MNIKKYEKLNIGKEDTGLKLISEKTLLGGFFLFTWIKSLFINKFSLIIELIDYSGNRLFYILKPKRDCFRVDGNVYVINDECVKKTNTKYNIIAYNEGNPSPKVLSHESNETITGKQLSNFMDSELVNMVLSYKKKAKFDFMIILIICGVALVGLLIVLHFLGVIDLVGFFLPKSTR